MPFEPYFGVDQTSLRSLIYFLKVNFNIIFLYTPRSSKFSFSLRNLHQILVRCPPFQIRTMCSVHLTLLGHPHMMERNRDHVSPRYALISSPPLPRPSCAQISFPSTILQTPNPVFFCQCEGQSFTSVQNNKQSCTSVHFNFNIFGLQTGIHKILN